MATVVAEIGTPSTSNASTYASGAFTPGTNDLLVVFCVATGTVDVATMSGSLGMTFTLAASTTKNAGADTLYMFVSDSGATASSQTVTLDVTGDNATGAIVAVMSVTGMTRYGSSAVKQSKVAANQTASTTPAATFDASCDTNNPTVGFVGNGTNPAGLTAPTNWTEVNDIGYNTPATGGEWVSRNSGFTGTTITWGSTSASAYGVIIAELDTSSPPAATRFYGLPIVGVG